MPRLNAMPARSCLLHALLAVWLFAQPAFGEGEPNSPTLRDQLHALAREHGFTLRGSERIENEPSSPVSASDLVADLKSLLHRYNYVMRQDMAGQVAEINILELRIKPAVSPHGLAIATTRIGSHHLVETILTGPRGARRKLRLIVDTGATSIVLPTSLIAELGFDGPDLSPGWADTAGGRTRSMIGRLRSVAVGRARRRDVMVAFIEDELIGDKALLGMSFLGHFRITIGQAENVLYLAEK